MPAEQEDFWSISPRICDFLKDNRCTHKEEFSGEKSLSKNYGNQCGISTCPFEKGF